MKAVFILSDALRHDYLAYMPFLRKMSGECEFYKKIIPGLGFCEISEYVSGIPSLENGNIFQITFSGKFGATKNHWLTRMTNIVNKIPRVRRYYAQWLDRRLAEKDGVEFEKDMVRVRYHIPLFLLHFFKPTESKLKYDDAAFFPQSNLFHKLRARGISYDIDDFVEFNKIRGSETSRLRNLARKIERRELKDFTLLYIGYGEIAHRTGTGSDAFHRTLAAYDRELERMFQRLEANYPGEYRFMILGDHGMVDVEKYIDLTELLKEISEAHSMKVGEDFVYFIDSTALRLWFRDSSVIADCDRRIRAALSADLDDVDLKRGDHFYGDRIYFLRPGRVFFPDFFNTVRNRGMHGYTNRIDEQKGMALILGAAPAQHEELELHEVSKLILRQFA
ncbi:MAG: alkaline phosphatase family protein [Oscillospiraceae bacterium]|nr:alkaline phosphatase family protein [Oscillospiraceae bacterium]